MCLIGFSGSGSDEARGPDSERPLSQITRFHKFPFKCKIIPKVHLSSRRTLWTILDTYIGVFRRIILDAKSVFCYCTHVAAAILEI